MHSFFLRARILAAGVAATAVLAACGGGGGGSDDTGGTTPPPVTTTTVSGAVVKGPVSGANVCAYKAVAGGKGDQLLCVTSAAAGTYSMDLTYVGDVVIEATGGTYLDEATNTTKTLTEPMQVVLAAQGGNATGVVTPLTSVAYSLSKSATGGVSSVSFAASVNTVATQFQVSGTNLATTVPVVSGSINGYGRLLRAVSQYIANGGNLATFQGFQNAGSFQSAFSSAYVTINGNTITFDFGGGANGGGSNNGGGGNNGGSNGGTAGGTLTIEVTAAGVTGPKVVIQNFPKPASQSDFCGQLTGSSQLNQFSTAGGTLTINSCSFSGNVGTVNATVSIAVQGFQQTIPYTATYTFN